MSHKTEANRPWKPEEMDWPTLVNALTNWQRHQWAKAGYPGLHKQEREKLLPFVLTKNS